MRTRSAMSALFALATALSSACVLFSSGSGDLGMTCTFQGQGSTMCGECIAASCQPSVNACCGDGTCSASLAYLDACASGAPSSCATLSQGELSTATPFLAALGACILDNCKVCGEQVPDATAPGLDAPTSGVSCSSANGTCFCGNYDFEPPNGVACQASMFANGICCADRTYPASGGSCTCSPFSCQVYTDDCLCSSDYDDESSMPTSYCGGMTCCVSSGQCDCSVGGTCDSSDETAVATCTPANTGCSGDQVSVTSCSP